MNSVTTLFSNLATSQGLHGFFDAEEVGIFGKIMRCANTAGMIFIYSKADNIINVMLDLMKEDIRGELGDIDLGDIVKTLLFPTVINSSIITGIAIARSKSYPALDRTLSNLTEENPWL